MALNASEWIRYTLSALAGVCVTLVVVTLAFGDVRRDAADGKALEPRVGALELRLAGDSEWRNALDKRLGRIEDKLDAIAGR